MSYGKARFWSSTLAALALIACCQQLCAAPAEKVEPAIQRMREFLYSRQDGSTGSWETRRREDSSYFGHTTALVTWALLQCGESYQHPQINRALDFLAELRGGDVYTVYPRVLCWSRLPSMYKSDLDRDARVLLTSERAHSDPDKERLDHRTRLYQLMALDAFARSGGSVPRRIWEAAADELIGDQHRHGGWSSGASSDGRTTSIGSVTCLTSLYICRANLADNANAVAVITETIERGERFVDRNFAMGEFVESTGKAQSHEAAFHDLFILERMSRYSGVQAYGEQQWFPRGVEAILSQEGGRGSIRGDLVETAFALAFLSQARACVWITKLRIADARTDNRPRDMHVLTELLSGLRERDLHWHSISVDQPLRAWLTSPILYLSSDLAIALTDEQKGRIRRYLELGGLLLANPEGQPTGNKFRDSMMALGQELFPQYTFVQASESAVTEDLRRGTSEWVDGFAVLSNGIRELIVIPDRDLQIPVEVSELISNKEQVRFWYNLYALSSEHGRLTTRLHDPIASPDDEGVTRKYRVIRAMHNGDWNVEPMVWPVFAQWMRSTSQIDLDLVARPLPALSEEDVGLLHLAGTIPITLNEADRDALRSFVERGGTILVETMGGMGGFTTELVPQLEQLFRERAVHLGLQAQVFSGSGVHDSPKITRVVYRPYSVLRFGVGTAPRLQAIHVDGRPAIYVSEEDISLAVLGIRRWPIHGYRQSDAQALLQSVVMHSVAAEGRSEPLASTSADVVPNSP